jgi:hypothetical protein
MTSDWREAHQTRRALGTFKGHGKKLGKKVTKDNGNARINPNGPFAPWPCIIQRGLIKSISAVEPGDYKITALQHLPRRLRTRIAPG